MILLRFYLKILHEHHKIFWVVSYINLIIDDFSHHLYGKTVFLQTYSDLKVINLRENVEWQCFAKCAHLIREDQAYEIKWQLFLFACYKSWQMPFWK